MKAFTLLVIALLATSAYADDTHKTDDKTVTTPKEPAKKEKLTANELQILAHYHELNVLEVDLGKTAMKKSTNQAVKSYGEMLVKDHGDADKKLLAMAKKYGQTIPKEKAATDADKAEKAQLKKDVAALKKLKGADFEREYLRMMVDGHEKELAKVDGKMAETQNEDVLEMLRGKKPTLQHHADAARELQKSGAQASR